MKEISFYLYMNNKKNVLVIECRIVIYLISLVKMEIQWCFIEHFCVFYNIFFKVKEE